MPLRGYEEGVMALDMSIKRYAREVSYLGAEVDDSLAPRWPGVARKKRGRNHFNPWDSEEQRKARWRSIRLLQLKLIIEQMF